ncbi:alpha/beta fold hydrolase [Camelliibacillus cellulosilyticus]|uniref:Alpha/beta fold hydrolase n=1 Tax=Camelliibacillus cellulosilyticus TaxID=2174486 RepID=A0ABV9GNH2_9BACL
MFKSRTPKFNDKKGRELENSIAVLEPIRVGGIKQWVMIRGENQNKPLLLFLHGGPGSAQIGFIRPYEKALEKGFVVVNWDQRGAGKSVRGVNPQAMTIDQMVKDTHEVMTHLLSRFHREKLFLVGHSWGSVLGALVAKKYPDLLYAYVGVSQVVHMENNERLSYEYSVAKAREANHNKAIRSLTRIGEPPYPNFKAMMAQRKWVLKFSPMELSSFFLFKEVMFSKEYTLMDWLRYIRAVRRSHRLLWDEFLTVDLFKQVPALAVPTFFCEGRHDYQAPFELVEQYMTRLIAPYKKIFWFDRSAHSPHLSEPKRFAEVCQAIKQRVYRLTFN